MGRGASFILLHSVCEHKRLTITLPIVFVADLQRLKAVEREEAGTRAAARLRKSGRTPAILFSLPRNASRLISMDSKQITSLVRHPMDVHPGDI